VKILLKTVVSIFKNIFFVSCIFSVFILWAAFGVKRSFPGLSWEAVIVDAAAHMIPMAWPWLLLMSILKGLHKGYTSGWFTKKKQQGHFT
jgi:hypothetical protein